MSCAWGAHTRLARDSEIRKLIGQRDYATFLELPCTQATLADLDLLALHEFLGRVPRAQPAETYLEPGRSLGGRAKPFIDRRQRVPNRFTVLLFGREPARFFAGAAVVFSLYEATDRASPNSVTAEITGPLVLQVRGLMERLEAHAGIQIDKTQSPLNGSPNRPRYSLAALREAAMNALVHRDYEDPSPTRVTMFSDRVEFLSPGGLPPEVDPDLVRAGRADARWRNPSLAQVMTELGFVQERGSGIPLMLRETRDLAGRDPEFEFAAGSVKVTIPAYVPWQRVDVGAAGEQALVLLSIGGPTIRDQVEASLDDLGLGPAGTVLDYAHEGYVETEREWQACAQEIRNRLRVWGDAPQVRHFHVFYRGPVAFAALVGALIPHAKAFSMYHFGERGYERAFTVDRRFRARKD